MAVNFGSPAASTISVPQVDTSWLGRLMNGGGQTQQPPQAGAGYFPPAPTAASGSPATPSSSSFLQQLFHGFSGVLGGGQ